MIAHAVFFYVFSVIAVVSAIMVTVSKNTVHSVFFLILDFISISCLFIMIGAEFLGMIMLIVYVGAVAVLFLFVVMMLNIKHEEQSRKSVWLSYLFLLIFSLIFFYSTFLYFESAIDEFAQTEGLISNTREIGIILYTEFTYAFIIAGILLLQLFLL